MREILFRGKTKQGLWVCGFYFYSEAQSEHLIIGDSKDYGLNKMEIIPSTVGQYTGKTDKNKQKVFEGDVVRVEYLHNGTPESEIRTVQWDDTNSGYAPLNWNEYCEGCDENTEIVSIEIIGTIHDKEG